MFNVCGVLIWMFENLYIFSHIQTCGLYRKKLTMKIRLILNKTLFFQSKYYMSVNINNNSKTIMAIREISNVIIATPYVFGRIWK